MRCSSKPAVTGWDTGQAQASVSSSEPAAASLVSLTSLAGAAGADAADAALAEATGGLASSGRVSTLGAVATGLAVTADASTPGGTTRSTCPTSIRFGFSRLFHLATSRQLWPLSSAMRISASPGLTV